MFSLKWACDDDRNIRSRKITNKMFVFIFPDFLFFITNTYVHKYTKNIHKYTKRFSILWPIISHDAAALLSAALHTIPPSITEYFCCCSTTAYRGTIDTPLELRGTGIPCPLLASCRGLPCPGYSCPAGLAGSTIYRKRARDVYRRRLSVGDRREAAVSWRGRQGKGADKSGRGRSRGRGRHRPVWQ